MYFTDRMPDKASSDIHGARSVKSLPADVHKAHSVIGYYDAVCFRRTGFHGPGSTDVCMRLKGVAQVQS